MSCRGGRLALSQGNVPAVRAAHRGASRFFVRPPVSRYDGLDKRWSQICGIV